MRAPALLLSSFFALLPLQAQAPLPANYQIVLDTPQLAVYHVHYGAHEHVPEHPHPGFPTIFIYLDDSGPIRFTHVGTPPEITERPPSHTGSFRVAPALAESHMVDNLGDAPSDSIRVEFKQVPPGIVQDVFRGAAPTNLVHDLDQVVYKTSAFSIERIVCQPGETCHAAEAHAPSILVAFTPAALIMHSSGWSAMLPGDVRAVSGEQLAVRSSSPQAAHLLRIILAPR